MFAYIDRPTESLQSEEDCESICWVQQEDCRQMLPSWEGWAIFLPTNQTHRT